MGPRTATIRQIFLKWRSQAREGHFFATSGRCCVDQDDLTKQFTRVLSECTDAELVRGQLTPIVYEQLRAIAQRRMMSERRGHTLQATALVHEALMRLNGDRNVSAEQETHYYASAAEAMRRVLIDHARKKGSKKRAGKRVALLPDVLDLASDPDPDIVMALDEALTQLAIEDKRAAEVVNLRFFAGLEVDEVAKTLQISPRTVAREWAYAKTRLFQMLSSDGSQ